MLAWRRMLERGASRTLFHSPVTCINNIFNTFLKGNHSPVPHPFVLFGRVYCPGCEPLQESCSAGTRHRKLQLIQSWLELDGFGDRPHAALLTRIDSLRCSSESGLTPQLRPLGPAST